MDTVDNVDRILALIQRVLRAGGYGRIEIPPPEPLDVGAIATVHVQPSPEEQQNLLKLLARLKAKYEYNPRRDRLELTYEGGRLTLARISFAA